MESEPTGLRRALGVALLLLLRVRGDLLLVAGASMILLVLWTIDWRLAVASAGATLVALGARL